jgi:hypothetical protein
MKKKKFIEDWDNFIGLSSNFLAENMHKSRITFKYRNKLACGRLYVTNENKVIAFINYYYSVLNTSSEKELI